MKGLDIGCWYNKTPGFVGLDVVPYDDVDVIANAEILPFKDNSFEEVEAKFIIEHLYHPDRLVNEIIRCAKNKVTIKTDNLLSWSYLLMGLLNKARANHKEHCFGWTVATFRNFLGRSGYKFSVESNTTGYYWSPLWYMRIFYKIEKLVGKIPLGFFQRDTVAYWVKDED